MNESEQNQEPVVEQAEHFDHLNWLKTFDDLSFKEKWHKVFEGLKAPKNSGQYKYAKLQMIRLSAPVASIIVPILMILILMVFSQIQPPPRPQVEVQIIEPEPIEKLDDIDDIIEQPPDPIEMDFTPTDHVGPVMDNSAVTPGPEADFSPQPASFDSVAMVKSPVIMKGIYGSRSPGSRGSALGQYGGSGATEGAVLRALRWLKKEQRPNGSWAGTGATAMTGLALLTYLAHGETPTSVEFGETVEKAIRYLVDASDDRGQLAVFAGNYDIPISTYALCEAYALTKVPMIKEAAERNMKYIIEGQNAHGSFNYNCRGDRSDLSYAGWCYQAIKAGLMAELEVPGLEEARKKGIMGCKAHSNGVGFGYGLKSCSALTGVGVLCMQLFGAAREPEVRAGLAYMANWRISWTEKVQGSIYHWYYITQAKFHEGGETWNSWNKQFSPELVRTQIVIPKAILGPTGKMEDIGYWEGPEINKGHSGGLVMDTSMCAMMLQVYYRYLPTFKKPEEMDVQENIISDDEINIEIAS
ncbi:MAG: terpene cyclase/mutase family protein [Lentisphaerae bacterium]|nr:terpene cyclase/mutase family protein [Lentisphaerota bacterium]